MCVDCVKGNARPSVREDKLLLRLLFTFHYI